MTCVLIDEDDGSVEGKNWQTALWRQSAAGYRHRRFDYPDDYRSTCTIFAIPCPPVAREKWAYSERGAIRTEKGPTLCTTETVHMRNSLSDMIQRYEQLRIVEQ